MKKQLKKNTIVANINTNHPYHKTPGFSSVGLYDVFIIATVKPEWAPSLPQAYLDSISKAEMRRRVMKALVPHCF